ncbi:MAG: exosortase T, partial [Rickettsiales bacterium]|nr:exosortase T [Rickettsiales bacterium]
MTDKLHKHHILIAAYALTMLGAFILAIHPIQWLVNSWRDPSYDSNGLWIFICVVGLFVWSITSNNVAQTERINQHHLALLLLIATALVRLISQVLAINIIGAVALIIDVYALGLLMNLSGRKRSVSPGWLAIIFAFSLPLERVIQRTIGYALQHVSADGSCIVLSTLFESVTCEGIRILINGTDVLVDLPCSGARSTLLLLLLFSMFMALHRPNFMHGVLGLLLTMLCALIANVIRITMLAIGLAYSSSVFGINVMQSPWHDLIGIVALAIGSIPIIWGVYAIAPT